MTNANELGRVRVHLDRIEADMDNIIKALKKQPQKQITYAEVAVFIDLYMQQIKNEFMQSYEPRTNSKQ